MESPVLFLGETIESSRAVGELRQQLLYLAFAAHTVRRMHLQRELDVPVAKLAFCY